MSKLNINKTEWLELVFEGKNKAYGAYQLRQEEGKTTTKAFVSAMALLGGIAALPFILSSFTDKPKIVEGETILDDQIHLVRFKTQPKVTPPAAKVIPPAAKTEAPKTIDLINPRVVDSEVAPDTNITTNDNLGQNAQTDTNAGGTEGGTSTGTVVTPAQPEPEEMGNVVLSPNMVEKSPNFPGGIDEFLKIVGKRFETPEVEEEGTVRVMVYFVVEKDGSLSNIVVPKNPGFGLDKEAIRVLKSIKTKWEPGMYKGKPVRTQYSLPIVVQMQ